MKYDLNFKLDCVGKYKEGRLDFAQTEREELRLLRERNTDLEAELAKEKKQKSSKPSKKTKYINIKLIRID